MTRQDASRERRGARRPLFEVWPSLARRVPLEVLGDLPTPIRSLAPVFDAAGARGVEAFVKRDDITSPVYGGNKVRTLEVLFGQARAEGASHIYSTGAFGSNHATAMVLHAPLVGLKSGVVLFPQPSSHAALENLRVCLSRRPTTHVLPHWSALPLGMFSARRAALRRGDRPYVMVPGGATPLGALGYVSAALELAEQVEAGDAPRPSTVVVAVGSCCTSAGLLVGFHHAARLGIGFRDASGRPAPPDLVSVRVTPWPVTSAFMILRLAARASRLLADLAGEPRLALTRRDLAPRLRVESRFLGRGYGYATEEGTRALRLWHEAGEHELDTTYSAKSAAAVLELGREGRGEPIVYWSTKSSVPLPSVDARDVEPTPVRMRRWIAKAEAAIDRRDVPGPEPWR